MLLLAMQLLVNFAVVLLSTLPLVLATSCGGVLDDCTVPHCVRVYFLEASLQEASTKLTERRLPDWGCGMF